jgi:anti-sigma regulatory factor (Ser/Thr protein kinase)
VSTTRRFEESPSAPRDARAFVAGELGDAEAETRDAAVLMTSELATNSVRHARTGFTVTVERFDGHVRVTIEDRGVDRPQRRSPSPQEPTGRGLGIVASLAAQWGSRISAVGGNCVWFTLPVSAVTTVS